MKCITVRRTSDNSVEVTSGISRPYRCNESGLYTWVGSAHDNRVEGSLRHLDVHPRLLGSEHSHDQRDSKRFVVWECGLIREPDSRPRLVPRTSQENSTTALVLLTVHGAELLCKSEKQVTQGWSKAHVDMFVLPICCEQLFEMSPGDSVVFTTREYPDRVLGFAVHGGRETTRKMTFDGKKVTIDLVNEQPLPDAPRFLPGYALRTHLLFMAAIVAIGFLLGLANGGTKLDWHAGLIRGQLGVAFFMLLMTAHWLLAWKNRPRILQR